MVFLSNFSTSKSKFKKNNKFFTNLIVYGVSIPILIIFLRPVNQSHLLSILDLCYQK